MYSNGCRYSNYVLVVVNVIMFTNCRITYSHIQECIRNVRALSALHHGRIVLVCFIKHITYQLPISSQTFLTYFERDITYLTYPYSPNRLGSLFGKFCQHIPNGGYIAGDETSEDTKAFRFFFLICFFVLFSAARSTQRQFKETHTAFGFGFAFISQKENVLALLISVAFLALSLSSSSSADSQTLMHRAEGLRKALLHYKPVGIEAARGKCSFSSFCCFSFPPLHRVIRRPLKKEKKKIENVAGGANRSRLPRQVSEFRYCLLPLPPSLWTQLASLSCGPPNPPRLRATELQGLLSFPRLFSHDAKQNRRWLLYLFDTSRSLE